MSGDETIRLGNYKVEHATLRLCKGTLDPLTYVPVEIMCTYDTSAQEIALVPIHSLILASSL